MGNKTAGKWFKSKKGNNVRYWYKDGLRYGLEIQYIGFKLLDTNEFTKFIGTPRRQRTREIQKVRRIRNDRKMVNAHYLGLSGKNHDPYF